MWSAMNNFVVILCLLFIEMGRVKALNADEKRKIIDVESGSKASSEALGQSRHVMNYLKYAVGDDTKSTVRPKYLSERDKRSILRQASFLKCRKTAKCENVQLYEQRTIKTLCSTLFPFFTM